MNKSDKTGVHEVYLISEGNSKKKSPNCLVKSVSLSVNCLLLESRLECSWRFGDDLVQQHCV